MQKKLNGKMQLMLMKIHKWKDAVDAYENSKNDEMKDIEELFGGGKKGKKGTMGLEDLLGEIMGMGMDMGSGFGEKKKKKKKK